MQLPLQSISTGCEYSALNGHSTVPGFQSCGGSCSPEEETAASLFHACSHRCLTGESLSCLASPTSTGITWQLYVPSLRWCSASGGDQHVICLQACSSP